MARSRTISSAHVVLYINSTPIGRVTGMRFSSDTPRRAIYSLDHAQPFELIPQSTRVTGSISFLRTIGDGGVEGLGIVAPLAEISREKYFSILLIERSSDTVVFKADRCSLVNQTWEVRNRAIIEGIINFEAIDFQNEVRNPAP